MRIVSNTTPIISLIKINKLELLKELFDEVYISKGVYEELIANKAFNEEIKLIKRSDFIKIVAVKNELAVKLLQKNMGLDLGESESIVLYDESKADLLIIDEKKGRSVAKSISLNVVGTLGILLKAKDKDLIENIKPLLDKMIDANIRISNDLYNEIINKSGE